MVIAQERARRAPPHPVVDTLPGLFAALSSIEAASLQAAAQPVNTAARCLHAAALRRSHMLWPQCGAVMAMFWINIRKPNTSPHASL